MPATGQKAGRQGLRLGQWAPGSRSDRGQLPDRDMPGLWMYHLASSQDFIALLPWYSAGHVGRSLAFALLPRLNLTEVDGCHYHSSHFYIFAPADSLLGMEQSLGKQGNLFPETLRVRQL